MGYEGGYAFDNIGATICIDISGWNRPLDLTGSAGAQVSDGTPPGGALGKTGAAMPVFPASLLAATQTDDRCVMFDAIGNLATWWIRWEKDAINSGVWGVLNVSGNMAVQARKASDDSLATRPVATSPSTTKHHYCATYVRSTGLIKLYLDGVLTTPGPPNGQSSFPAATQLTINADRINIAEWSTTGAAIKNLRFFSHVPSDAEISRLAVTPVTRSNHFFAA